MSETRNPTDAMIDAKDERDLRARLEVFFKEWAPQGDTVAHERFYADFHMLVSRIFMEAQKPFLKTLHDALSVQSLMTMPPMTKEPGK